MLNKAVLLRAADSELWWSLKKHPLAKKPNA